MAIPFLYNSYFAGTVGIGTESPLKKLSISGGDVAVNNGNSFIVGAAITGNTQIGELGADAGQLQLLTESTRDIKFGSTTYGNIMFLEGSNGSVGIGTTSPGTINGVAFSSVGLHTKFGTLGRTITEGTSWGEYIMNHSGASANQRAKFIQSKGGSFNLGSYDDNGTQRVHMTVLNSGNLGIGTTSPTDAKLEVEGNVNSGLFSVFAKNSNAGSAAYVSKKWQNNDSGFGEIWRNSSTRTSAGQGVSSFNMYNSADINFWSSGTHTMALFNNKVGIGETLPDRKLHVNSGTDNANTIFESTDTAVTIRLKDSTGSAEIESRNDFRFSNNAGVDQRMVISAAGAIKFNNYGAGYLKTDANGNITAAGASQVGPFLPLAGGTMTGTNGVVFPDVFKLNLGTGSDLQIVHDSFDSYINNFTGNLYIKNLADDKDIIFQNDDGAGGVETYFFLDGSAGGASPFTVFPDNSNITFGSGYDLRLYHNGTTSFVENYLGDLTFAQYADDKMIRFFNDNGSGGVIEYLRIDGSSEETVFSRQSRHVDSVKATFGNSADLQIFHDGTHSFVNNLTGDLTIDNQGDDLILKAADDFIVFVQGSDIAIQANGDGKVGLRYNNVEKFETTSGGVTVTGGMSVGAINTTGTLDISSTYPRINLNDTNSEDDWSIINDDGSFSIYNVDDNVHAFKINGSNNATFAGKAFGVTPLTADSSSMLATKGYVQDQIAGGATYLGLWDPDVSLNSGYGNPNLNPSTRTDDSGDYFICSDPGAATPNGTGNEPDSWEVGDWVVWNEDLGGGTWQRVDNSSVLSGVGTGQTVALWQGLSGVTDSETLGNAPITFSGNNSTFAGDVALTGDLKVTAEAATADIVAQWADSNGNNTATFRTTTPGQIFEIRSQNSGTLKFDSTSSTFTGNVAINGNATLGDGTSDDHTFNGQVNHITGDVLGYKLSRTNGATSMLISSNSDSSLQFGTDNGSGTNTTQWTIGKDGTDNSFRIANSASLGTTDALTIKSGGNVGIGTTSPSTILHVASTSNPVILVQDLDGTNQSGSLGHNGGDTTFVSRNNTANGKFTWYGYNGTTFSPRMTIAADGNVGIGTTTPDNQLHVANSAGDAYIRMSGGGSLGDTYGGFIRGYGVSGQGGNLDLGVIDNSTFKIAMNVSPQSNVITFSTAGTGRMVIGDSGSIKFNAYNSTNKTGTPTYILGTDASGNVVKVLGADIPGVPGGSGTLKTIPLWTPDGDTLGNSIITQPTSAEVRVSGTLKVSSTVAGYSSTRIQTGGFADSQSGINILNSTTGYGYILFGDGSGADLYRGQITYKHGDDFMAFNTAGSQKMTILANGNVGIGNTLPGAKLVVGANVNSAATGIEVNAGGTSGGNASGGNVFAAGTAHNWFPYIDSNNYYSALDHIFRSEANSATRMTIKSSGFVGIGTTSPTQKLNVVNDNTATWTAKFTNNTNNVYLSVNDANNYGIYVSGETKNHFSGNVGIGTTSPSQKLHVVGKGLFTDDIQLTQTSPRIDYGNTTTAGALRFWSANAGSEKMRIESGGNVGIGTTSPQSKLQVAGGIQMADDTATPSATKVGTMRYRTGTEYVDVTGTELVTNGDFATDTAWTKPTGGTISGGLLNLSSVANGQNTFQSSSIVIGQTYRATFTISNYVAGGLRILIGATGATTIRNSNGTFTVTVNAALDTVIYLQAIGTTTLSVDNVSVIEVTAEDASYADMCMQTGASTYEWVNIVRNTY